MDKQSRKKAKKNNGGPKQQQPIMCPLMAAQYFEPSPLEPNKSMPKNVAFSCMGQGCAWWVVETKMCAVTTIAIVNMFELRVKEGDPKEAVNGD